jgi:hypothetical protein
MRSPDSTAENLIELRDSLAGDVLDPSDIEYERARLCFNLLIDRRPAAIVRCLDAGDVAAALAFAREHDLESPCVAGATTRPGTASWTTAS